MSPIGGGPLPPDYRSGKPTWRDLTPSISPDAVRVGSRLFFWFAVGFVGAWCGILLWTAVR